MSSWNQRKLLFLYLFFGLVLLAIGPSFAPQTLGNFLRVARDGVPCEWLHPAVDPTTRQSLLARQAAEPLDLRVRAGPFPAAAETPWVVRIVVINRSAGTMPILHQPDQILLSDDPESSGFGLLFRPPLPLQNFASRTGQTSYPLADLRLLGAKQRCHIELEFPSAAAIIDSESVPVVTLQAYYRVLEPGSHPETVGDAGQGIFPDQGLRATAEDAGVIYSPQVELELKPPG
ncbi:MAG: hypothetical protein OXG02_00290 [Chloroflexi bacterium]|nr:hypothetical protein [Chloroflexota bacterium]